MLQRKLLLADDSITIQKVVNLTFADEGIEVVTVGDGDAAIEKIAEFKPDLIMADVNMPGLNGYQICERIRQDAELGETPVILLVGSFEPFDEAEAQRVGANDFLTKPFQSIRQLVNKVTELLDSTGKSANSAAEKVENFSAAEAGAAASRFGDNEIDDEMIQTDQPSGFGFDESAKFETRESSESAENSARSDSETKGRDVDKASEFDFSSRRDFSTEPSFDRDSRADKNSDSETLDFADDFLELPPEEDEEVSEAAETTETAASSDAAPVQETAPAAESESVPAAETQVGKTESLSVSPETESAPNDTGKTGESETISAEVQPNAAAFAALPQLSPETIDIIAQKVVERLSDKIVREIAWEVVPQMADLIVKKLAEEKIKES